MKGGNVLLDHLRKQQPPDAAEKGRAVDAGKEPGNLCAVVLGCHGCSLLRAIHQRVSAYIYIS